MLYLQNDLDEAVDANTEALNTILSLDKSVSYVHFSYKNIEYTLILKWLNLDDEIFYFILCKTW